MNSRISVISRGPFAVGSVVFRDNHGQFIATVIAKITYSLAPGIAPPLDEPLPIQEDDDHWDDDPARSVHVPSDLAPFKKAPEVVVVGSAFAPGERPAASVVARVIVGSVDKSVEIHVPRYWRENVIEDAPRARRFPLRYEYAAGGADTDNPMGIDMSRPDARGRWPVPQMVPVAFDIGSQSAHVPTTGLGPLSSTSRVRSGELSVADRAWLSAISHEALPQGFPSNYFQSAPMDQWLVRPLAANERIVLENLHQRHARLVMTLAGIEPQAVMVGHAEPIRMRGDLLVIDSDRALCTLTFRGHVPVSDANNAQRIVITALPMGTTLSAEQVHAIAQSVGDETLGDDEFEIADDGMEMTRDISPAEFAKMVPSSVSNALPFHGNPVPPAPAPPSQRLETVTTLTSLRQRTATVTPAPSHNKDETLPFIAPPQAAKARQPSYSDISIAPPMSAAPPMPPPMVSPHRSLSLPNTQAPAPPPPPVALVETKPRAEVSSIAPQVEPAKPVSALMGLRARESAAAPRAKESSAGVVLSVVGASDAAAREEKGIDTHFTPPVREMPTRSTGQTLRRLAVVDLLSFDAKIAPRLRSNKRLASFWALPVKPKSPLSPDEPQRPPSDPDRDIVLRVLSCAEGQGPAEIRRVLAESLDDVTDLEPPLVVCAGELVPRFDDVETLRASVAVASSVAGTDKRMLSAIAVAQEALSASLAPAPETLRNLAKQIETASSSLALPPRFISTNVERVLVENRSYKRRLILGALRVRADLVVSGGEVFALYLPDDVAKSLPLLPSFAVMTVCEVRPREDLAESQAEALLCVALGRVLHGRGT